MSMVPRGSGISKEDLIKTELEIKEMWEAGQIKVPLHLCGGQEEQLIEIFKEVRRDDYVFCSHRHHYHYLLHGGDLNAFKRGLLGLPDGLCLGRAGSMGTIDPKRNFYSSAILGGVCGIAVGAGWAIKEVGGERRVWCFVGDGVLDGGHFWEALQYVAGFDLPVTFVVEHNDRATCTDVVSRLGTGHLQLDESYKNYLRIYGYSPTWPHVGSGKYVAF